jgi:protein SCO1/2
MRKPFAHSNSAVKAILALTGLLCFFAAGCGQKAEAPAKRFVLKGKVISIDKAQGRMVVDHEAIPGFMGAMAMPYPVADPKLLDARY